MTVTNTKPTVLVYKSELLPEEIFRQIGYADNFIEKDIYHIRASIH